MPEVIGVIKAIAEKENKFGLRILPEGQTGIGFWINSEGEPEYSPDEPIIKGDKVKIKYGETSFGNRLETIQLIERPEQVTKENENGFRAPNEINAEVALREAREFHKENQASIKYTKENITETAKYFYQFIKKPE